MSLREKISSNNNVGMGVGIGMVVLAAIIFAVMYWPETQADLNQAYYSDDDGKNWFADSAFRVAPFERNGKTAVVAHIYNYAGGSKEFCGYLAKFTPEAKAKLEAAIAEAKRNGKDAGSVSLWTDQGFMRSAVVVKKPGDSAWIGYSDPKANAVFSVKSPDGSEIDQSFVK